MCLAPSPPPPTPEPKAPQVQDIARDDGRRQRLVAGGNLPFEPLSGGER